MSRIQALLVDDEPLAREELTRILKESGDIGITEAISGEEALEKMESTSFDVVFLDIEMPGISGLEVASELLDFKNPPVVIFATAFHQYAVDAFEARAMDYILKPYDSGRLMRTMNRVRDTVAAKTSGRDKLESLEAYLIQKGALKKIVGHNRNSKDRIVIHSEEVYFFHAHYADLFAHQENQELIVNATLKETLSNLDPAEFAQTHKAYVVNIDKVSKVSPMFSGNFEIHFKGDLLKPVPLSRRYAKHFKGLLGGW